MQHSNAANRLDRLPISRFHKITLVAVAFAYFFEFADINTFAVTAPKLVKLWGVTVNQVAYVTSLSFVGMFFGSIIGGCHRRPLGPQERADRHHPVVRWSSPSPRVLLGHRVRSASLRVLTSAGLSAMTVVAVIYVNEIFPAARPRQVPGLRHRHRHLRHAGHQPVRQPRSSRSPTGRGGWSTCGAASASSSCSSPGT